MKYFYTPQLLMALITQNLFSQTTPVQIGSHDSTGWSESFLPVKFDGGAKTQFLITNDELKMANLKKDSEILGLQWYVIEDDTKETYTYDLYLSDDFTEAQLQADGYFANISTTLVGDKLTDVGQFTGWHTANFSTPFIWDGTDNMIVQLCREGYSHKREFGGTIARNETSFYSSISSYFYSNCNAIQGDNDQAYYHRPFVRLLIKTTTLGTTLGNEQVLKQISKIKIVTTPSSYFIEIQGLDQEEDYTIFNIQGAALANGKISKNQKINVKNLSKGVYFITLKNNALKFIRN